MAVSNRLEDMIAALESPRVVWLMVPAGAATEENVRGLAQRLEPGDIVVDGANSHYRDSQRRGLLLAERKIGFVDAGVSGGIWGLEQGYGLMLGGAREHVDAILPLIHALAPAPDRGWVHCGPSGAGHFAKMVHNGIEYGLMQAYAEGFSLLAARPDLGLPLGEIAEAWCHGTVIRSWLLELTAGVLKDEGSLRRGGRPGRRFRRGPLDRAGSHRPRHTGSGHQCRADGPLFLAGCRRLRRAPAGAAAPRVRRARAAAGLSQGAGAAARSVKQTARSRRTRLAGIAMSPSHRRVSTARRPAPTANQTMERASASAGSVRVNRR